MGKKRKELSQAEIWDDSALLQSWDDALAEYKVIPPVTMFPFFLIPLQFYHSIHARGERVEDAIKDVEAQEQRTLLDEKDLRPAAGGMQSNIISSKELEDGELDEEHESAHPYLNGNSTVNLHVSTQRNELPTRWLTRH